MQERKYPSQSAPRANFRMSDDVRQHLKIAAVMNRRSFNAEVMFRLQQSIEAEKKSAAEGATSPRHEHAETLTGNSDDYANK